jgi:uncharacterized protein (DUF1697 family)
MKRYVAFLRAINVGGHVVKMADLRRLFEACGLSAVETFIQSGNVVFESSDRPAVIEAAIERRLEEALGYRVATFLRTTREVAEVAATWPFESPEGSDGARLYVAFLRRAPDARTRDGLASLSLGADELRVVGREAYWLCRTSGQEATKTGALVGKALGSESTTRNVTTVRRIAAKYRPAERRPR